MADTAPQGAWARLERGEISKETFYPDFETDFSAREMLSRIGEVTQPRPSMFTAIERIRSAGLKLTALTNNWVAEEDEGQDDGTRALSGLFDVFVESSVEGLRKPDPRIYELGCSRLEISPNEAIFLDDVGSNLKSARAMGMQTIKVVTPERAPEELSGLLGIPFLN